MVFRTFPSAPHLVLTLIASSFLLWSTGCSYDSEALSELACDEEGEIDGNRVCTDGYWVADDSLDADIDDVPPDPDDADPDPEDTDPVPDADADPGPEDADAPCTPDRSDEQLCAAFNTECGEVVVTDSCDTTRELECDLCGEDEYCLDDSESCSPCPDLSVEELCDEVDNELECAIVSLPAECNGETEFTCGDCTTHCEEWSSCELPNPIETCAETDTQTRTCTPSHCDENSCVPGDSFEEQRECSPSAGTPCQDVPPCHAGSCDDSGSCVAEFLCEGTTSSCECDGSSCQACNDDGWYDVEGATAEPCCDGNEACATCIDQEFREYFCDDGCDFTVTDNRIHREDCSDCGSNCSVISSCSPTEENQCTDQGEEIVSCQTLACDASTATCEPEGAANEEAVSCTYDPDGDDCDLSGCDEGTGSCDGTSCESPCAPGECGCGNGDCTECADLNEEEVLVGSEVTCDIEDSPPRERPCRTNTYEDITYECNAAGTECVEASRNETTETDCLDWCGTGGSSTCNVSDGTACCDGTTDCLEEEESD